MNVCVRFKTQKVARRLQRGGVMDVAVLTEEQRAERQTQVAVTIVFVCFLLPFFGCCCLMSGFASFSVVRSLCAFCDQQRNQQRKLVTLFGNCITHNRGRIWDDEYNMLIEVTSCLTLHLRCWRFHPFRPSVSVFFFQPCWFRCAMIVIVELFGVYA